MKKILETLFILLVMLPAQAFAGYNANVNKVANWQTAAGKIAIAPAVCPSDFDCTWLNREISGYVDKKHPFVAGPEQVSQAMLEENVESLDGDGAGRVASRLGVDSFLLVIVGNAETHQQASGVILPAGNGFLMAHGNIAQGNVEIRVVTSEGRSLARGTGHGESGFKKGRKVVGKIVRGLVDELLDK